MRVLILGATGKTGQHVVTLALEAGHDVTALVRNRARLPAAHARLRLVEGDVTDSAALTESMRGQDAVTSALGRGMSFKSERLIQRCVPPILAAMKAHGVRRLVFTSAIGVGATIRDAPLLPWLFAHTMLRGIYADKIVGDNLIRQSGLDWTIVQPTQLTDGPLTKRYRSGERLALRGLPSISRADAAHFIVAQLADPSSIGKTLLVSD